MNASEYCEDGSAKFKAFSGEDSRQSTPIINYIHVQITDEEKQKINSAIGGLVLNCPNILALFWAAEKIGGAFVLTPTSQPFDVRGNNKKLESYLKACLKHKQYVNVKTGTAIGLAARVFMSGDPEQTQNVHDYPEHQRPPCDDEAVFDEKWGAFAVIVGLHDKRLGVLEIVTDTFKESYEDDIHQLRIALENAGLQCRCFPKLADLRTINNDDNEAADNDKEDSRKTRNTISKKMARYNLLVPHFGLPASIARERLTKNCRCGNSMAENTFKKLCKLVHIDEWPGKRLKRKQNESTTTGGSRGKPKNSNRASSSRAPIRQASSEMEHQAVIMHGPADTMGVQHFDPHECNQDPVSLDPHQAMGAQYFVDPCLFVQEYCNEMGCPFIQNPDMYGLDAMDFQRVEPLIFQESHDIGNPHVPDHSASITSASIPSAIGGGGIAGLEWIEREYKLPDFMQSFDDIGYQSFQHLSIENLLELAGI